MAHTTHPLTAAELASLPVDGNRRELVGGVLHRLSPAGGRHGRIAGRLLLRIGNHVEQRKLGGFADHAGYLPLAPDVAAEVVSPSDESSKVESKVRDWLQAGTRVVLVVDPQTESIREYRSSSEIRVYENGTVDLRDILPSTVPVEYVGEWCAVWGDKLRGDDASNWQS